MLLCSLSWYLVTTWSAFTTGSCPVTIVRRSSSYSWGRSPAFFISCIFCSTLITWLAWILHNSPEKSKSIVIILSFKLFKWFTVLSGFYPPRILIFFFQTIKKTLCRSRTFSAPASPHGLNFPKYKTIPQKDRITLICLSVCLNHFLSFSFEM